MAFWLTACAFAPVKRHTYKVLEVLPHYTTSYTQGFFYHDGFFYESTGQYGRSLMAKVEMRTGQIVLSQSLDRTFFGEGTCLLNGRIYQLTWEENTCFVYDAKTFKPLGRLRYATEGWGLTTDGKQLILSDGTSTLYFMQPDTMIPQRTVTVTLNGNPVDYLNELEYIEGEIWANIYTSDLIVRIDPKDGTVLGTLDLKNILPASLRTSNTDVLNGIAYDPATRSIWVTGKNWPKIYKIQVQ